MILRKKLLDFIGRWVIDQNCGKGDRIKKIHKENKKTVIISNHSSSFWSINLNWELVVYFSGTIIIFVYFLAMAYFLAL